MTCQTLSHFTVDSKQSGMRTKCKTLTKKRKPGPPAYAARAKLPRYASHQTKLQADKNEARERETMSKIRLGFRYMWKATPLQMERARAKRPGEYDPTNHHAGVCWGWPKECTLTDLRASKIFRACVKSNVLTIDQIKVVRKSLAYAFELKGGKKGGNWPCVKGIMATIKLTFLRRKRRCCR